MERTGFRKVEKIRIDDLTPLAKNPRRHSERDIKALADNIRRYGFTQPILVGGERNVVYAGNGRVAAMKRLGYAEVPCCRIDDLPEQERMALAIDDNRQQELSEWDPANLRAIFDDLQRNGVSLVTMYEADLAAIAGALKPEDVAMPSDEEIDDAVPDTPQEPPTSRRGEVYILGRHRLMCGDSTSKEDVARLMAGREADLLLTDPPYNVDYGARGEQYKAIARKTGRDYECGKPDRKILNDNMDDAEFDSFLHQAFARAYEAMRKGAPFYVFHASSTQRTFENALEHNLLPVREQIIWVKDNLVLGRQDYQWRHEPVFYGWKEGAARTWNSDRKQTTVADIAPQGMFVNPDGLAVLTIGGRTWRFPPDTALEEVKGTIVRAPKPKRSAQHPTMKPVALLKYFIRNSSNENALVLDLFGGSGSTMAACEVTGRASASMELDPRYCDVIRQRYAALSGATGDWREATPRE